MRWCTVTNMWCSDIDDIEIEDIGCDGDCKQCMSVYNINWDIANVPDNYLKEKKYE